jgi:hypothetical protein
MAKADSVPRAIAMHWCGGTLGSRSTQHRSCQDPCRFNGMEQGVPCGYSPTGSLRILP